MTHPLVRALATYQYNRQRRGEEAVGAVSAPRALILDYARWAEQFTMPPGQPHGWYERPFDLMGLTVTMADRPRNGSFR